MAMVKSDTRGATATAMRPTNLARISHEQFLLMVRQHPEFALEVIDAVANRLRVANILMAR